MPPEKHNTQPVVQAKASSPPNRLRPNKFTIVQVATAPIGAATLNRARCVRAVRLDRPCFKRTDVSPKAAGALCNMIAKKMTSDSDVDEAVEEAPSAIPSAQAWTTSPIVVAEVFLIEGTGRPGVTRGVTASFAPAIPFRLREDELCGPLCRFDNDMCIGWYIGLAEESVSGRWSTKNIRM